MNSVVNVNTVNSVSGLALGPALRLGFGLNALGLGLDLGHGLDVTRRLRHATLFQDLGPVHQPLRQSLWFASSP